MCALNVRLNIKCDVPKPGGLADRCQPAETCVPHIMRPIHVGVCTNRSRPEFGPEPDRNGPNRTGPGDSGPVSGP